MGRRWSERARIGAQAGSQRGSPASPVMDLWGVCPGDAGVGRGAGWPRASAVSARAGPAEALVPASVSLGSTPRLLPCAPAGAVARRVALADGRSLPLKRCARPAPGSTFSERLGFRGRQGLIVTRRASLTRGGRPPPPVPSVPREAALPLLRSVSEPCSCVGPARCALAFFRTVLLLVVLSSPALLVLRPKTSASNAWKL